MDLSRSGLLAAGTAHIKRWCGLNDVVMPHIVTYDGNEPTFGTCAYYRNGVINIWPEACAAVGRAGRMWSWPGYVVDRTPYGVLAHELAHHVDKAHGPRGGIRAASWHRETGEAAITTYAPDVNEWFAESCRLYVTNPSLLCRLRPKMYDKLAAEWRMLAECRDWKQVLEGADRQIKAAENKITEAYRLAQRGPKPQQGKLL